MWTKAKKIIVDNKRTREHLVLSLEEFKKKFKTELDYAFQCYIQKKAFSPKFMQKNLTMADFMLSFAWNFNNYSNSNWYKYPVFLSIYTYQILKL